MRLERFRPEHLALIDLQASQWHLSAEIARPECGAMLAAGGPAFTGFVGDIAIGAAGIYEQWQGRGIAWALLSKQAGPHMLAIHRAVTGFLLQTDLPRVEAFVDADFSAGLRWMKSLGFTNETPTGPMRKYTPDGRDCYLFARVK